MYHVNIQILQLKKFLKIVGIGLLVLYVAGCGILYFIQDDIIFRPKPISPGTQFRFGKEVSIPVDDGVNLHGLYHQVDQAKGAVLYLHGNRGNARWCQRQAEMFSGYGYNVLLLDYRGYGKSDGKISSIDELYNDVQKAYDFLKNDFDESKIILAGYSLGTGMASYLAAHNQPQRLIMIAPYVSIADLKNRIFPLIPNFLIKYPLNNEKHLALLSCPVHLLHGTEDEVIPYNSSEVLSRTYPNKTKLTTLTNTGHRGAIFHGSIRELLKAHL